MGLWIAHMVWVAPGCTRLNASHCGNQAGDVTCQERNAGTPYCDRCEAANDGCVAEPVVEPACASGGGTDSGGSTTSGSPSSGSPSGESSTTTEEADSTGDDTPTCGNEIMEPGEACDGATLPPDVPSCIDMGYGDGNPVCAADCSAIIYSVCSEFAECGNMEVGAGEECDGGLHGKSCDDFDNLTGDGLVCTEQCTYNTSACMVCQENQQSCDNGEACCDRDAMCKPTLLMGMRCCVPGLLGACS